MKHGYRHFLLTALGMLVGVHWCLSLPWPDGMGWQMAGAPETENIGGHSNLSAPERIIRSMNRIDQPDSGSDSKLVSGARAGDSRAFARLYERHAGRLLPTLWRLAGGDHGKAEDLLQDAFVQAWNRLDQLRDPARFGSWLKQTAINLALSDRRRMRVTGDDSELDQLVGATPPWPSADLDLEQAIAGLPERARQVLVLFCLEGYSHSEIARTLGIEAGTSKGQLNRARQLLREVLS